MFSPIFPVLMFGLFLSYALLILPNGEDASLEISISENMDVYHEAALEIGSENAGGPLSPYLDNNAKKIVIEDVRYFDNMAGWISYGFNYTGDTYIVTFGDGDAASGVLREDPRVYKRAVNIARGRLEPEVNNTYIGLVRSGVGPQFYQIGNQTFRITGRTLPVGAPATLTIYEGTTS